jgi:hypothetical protein
MIQSCSTATERKPRGLAKPEAVARVQRGHHGKDSIPRGPAYCNQAGLSCLSSASVVAEARSDDGRLASGEITDRVGWAVGELREALATEGGVNVREEVTLYLDTTENHFARWLRDRVSSHLPPPHLAEDGIRIYLERARPPQRDGLAGRIDIRATAASQGGSVPMGMAISVRYMEYRPTTLEVIAECHLPEAVDYFEALLAAMGQRWPTVGGRSATGAAVHKSQRQGGRPGLDHDELIYRLAKAQEAEEIKRANPDTWWKMVAKEINWRHGIGGPGLTLLRDARKRLRSLEQDDPGGLLQEVAEWRRAQETRKT